jgi:transcriptional regulator with XRE-family HTH domain
VLANRIKELREKTGLKQKEFAEKLGIKVTTYNGYETGNHEPKSDFLISLAKEFNVTVDYILGLTDDAYSYYCDEGIKKSDTQEVSDAYEKADTTTKNHVRVILDLPKLDGEPELEEYGEDMETS